MVMWFEDWESLLRIVIHGTLGYIALVALVRISGKRTLSKMNAFDFVVTIALGSTFATLLVSPTIPLLDGVVAIALLIGLQWLVSTLYVRSSRFESLIKGTPQVVYWKGQYLERALRRERITREEVYAAMRSSNVSHGDVAAVLETEGTLTVFGVGDHVGLDLLEGTGLEPGESVAKSEETLPDP